MDSLSGQNAAALFVREENLLAYLFAGIQLSLWGLLAGLRGFFGGCLEAVLGRNAFLKILWFGQLVDVGVWAWVCAGRLANGQPFL
jgi:hypothetical protein